MRIFNYLFLLLISFYRKAISPFLPPTCRFTPTCSEYSMQAFKKYNFIKAFRLALARILRCHPFNKGGFDPLP